MKSLLGLAVVLFSQFASATVQLNDAIVIDGDIVIERNSDLIGASIEKGDDDIYVSLYLFAREEYEMCYIGNPKGVAKIAEQIVNEVTGDSEVVSSSAKVVGNKVVVDFDWYDEGGDHSTIYSLERCK